MAKSTPADAPARSASITVTPENGRGNAILAAWQGIYHLFNGMANFEITNDGVLVTDFSVDPQYDPEQIANDVSHRNRRLDLVPTYLWVQGMAPEPFVDAKEMTQWSVQFYRGSTEENSSRTPAYLRSAVAAFKTEIGIAKKRGPRKKIFRVENLSEIEPSTLQNLDAGELAKLQASITAALAAQSSNTVGDSNETTAEEAVLA